MNRAILKRLTNNKNLPSFVNFVFIGLFIVNPTDKTLFVLSFFHLAAMVLVTTSIKEALIYLFWPWFVFESGRVFSTTLVPLEIILSENYLSPVVSSFVFSPFKILGIFTTIHFITLRKKSSQPLLVLLIHVFVGLRLASAFLSRYAYLFSVASITNEIFFISWLFLTIDQLEKIPKKMLHNLFLTFISLMCVDILISLIQTIKGSYIGLNAERADYVVAYGSGQDEGENGLRVSGLWTHPNSLASWFVQLITAISLLGFSLRIKSFKRIGLFFYIIMLTVVSFFSLSRISILAMGFSITTTYKHKMTLINKFLNNVYKSNKLNYLLVMALGIILVGFSTKIFNRLYYSTFSLGESGGITTRLTQYGEAWKIIQISPLVGHGPGMYTAALLDWIPNGEVQYFPENVHNAFLLLAAESGLFTMAIAIVILFWLLWLSLKLENELRLIALTWFIFNALFMLLHPANVNLIFLGNATILLIYEYQKTKELH